MRKKTVAQVLISLLTALIIAIFFYKYLNKNIEIETSNEIINKDNINNTLTSNLTYDIVYTSSDLRGNIYKITSPRGEIDKNNSNIIFLEDVTANVFMKNSGIIKIKSKFGKYNLNSYDTIFTKDVVATYPGHKISGEYLDFSLLKDLGIMSENVIYENNDTNLFADRVEMKISTKDVKIFMTDNNKKVLVEKRN
jgi:hypothetical protein